MKRKKSNFIKYLLLTLVLLGGFTAQAQRPKAVLLDKVVAQIGDEIILLSDIQNQRLQLLQSGVEGNKQTDCEILEEFMYEKLLVNQAKIDSVAVPDDRVNQEMEQRIRYIASQIGSIEKLEEFYGKSVAQIKAEFFEAIKKRMLAEEMKAKITENVKVTPKEVEAFYNGLSKDSIPYINAKIKVAHLAIYPEITEKDKDMAYEELEMHRAAIVAGKSRFETLAAIHSDDPGSRLTGGSLGWQTRGTMVPEFEAALFNLKPMEVSEIFETQYGYHIVQLIQRKGDNYESRHILIIPKVSEEALIKAATTIDSVYNAIQRKTLTFEEAARRFSTDEGSNLNGGLIVNPYTGDYSWDIQNINEIDPQMSPIISRLQVGGISSPALYNNMAEQKQGIRIVKLVEKSEPHVAALNTDRQLIEMAALNEKRQKVIDKWIESKIGGNYVEIDPEYAKTCQFKYGWLAAAAM